MTYNAKQTVFEESKREAQIEKNQVIFLSFCCLNAHLLWCSLIKMKTHIYE